ncbi:MAG: fatty acid desaturase [Acidobacteriaceae bacterium]
MSSLSEVASVPDTLATEALQADSRALVQGRARHFNWLLAIWLAVFHIGAIAAFFFFSWSALAVASVLWVLGQNVGIAISYHRQLTHRGFVTPRWVEYAMALCATLALQGGPIYWVAVHRLHHQLTDRPGDPHSPHDGKWWSHMGWLLQGTLRNRNTLLTRYAPDLSRDSFYRWLSRYHWLPVTALGVGLFLIGGWPWLLWGIFLRVTLGMHVTWLVNSATHIWGSRRFETHDDSRNSWWVALLTGGEGWHNNHHALPVSTSHGMAWYELDFNYWCIRLLGFLGLAKRIKVQDAKAGPARILHV